MRRLCAFPLLMMLAVLPCAPVRAQDAPYAVAGHATTDSALIRQIRDSLVRRMEKAGVPGASITVMREGKVLWSEGFGWADVEQRVPVTALTRFRVGSVSKPLTSVAV